MSQTSTLRVLVDQALEANGDTFEDLIASHSDGPLYDVHELIVEETGIPVPLRTFYRWVEKLEKAAS